KKGRCLGFLHDHGHSEQQATPRCLHKEISLHQGRSRASGRHRDGEPHHDRGPGQREPVRRGRRYFTFYTPMRERNLIAAYLSPEFPNLYDDLYDTKGYWTTVYLNTLVLGYNTKIIPRNDLPKTYEGLLKPQFKQKFIIDIENHDVFVALSHEWGQEKAVN